METYYRANRKLLIPNGPGAIPSSIRVGAGEIFSLDGTEPIDVGLLLRHGAISPAEAPRKPAEGQGTAPGGEVVANPTSRRKPALRRKES